MFAINLKAHEDLLENIDDALFHAERRRFKPAANVVKFPPEPPNEEHSRGLIRVEENAIWRMQFSFFKIGDTYDPYNCEVIAKSLIKHPEIPIMIRNKDGKIVGKIKMERNQRYSVPVARMYRL